MGEQPEKLDFPERPPRIGLVLECIDDLLNGNFLVGLCVSGRANNSIGALPNRFDGNILGV